jgi:hypothetical protein
VGSVCTLTAATQALKLLLCVLYCCHQLLHLLLIAAQRCLHL